MKPLGMTPFFQVKMPTTAEDRIWDAVEEAIIAGMTPAQFKSEAAQAWAHVLKQEADDAKKELLK